MWKAIRSRSSFESITSLEWRCCKHFTMALKLLLLAAWWRHATPSWSLMEMLAPWRRSSSMHYLSTLWSIPSIEQLPAHTASNVGIPHSLSLLDSAPASRSTFNVLALTIFQGWEAASPMAFTSRSSAICSVAQSLICISSINISAVPE